VVEPDGRLAGVDPAEERASEHERLVLPASRGLSMTKRLINATRLITVVATGAHAGGHLRGFGSRDGGAFPSPIGGALRWYLDREACPA